MMRSEKASSVDVLKAKTLAAARGMQSPDRRHVQRGTVVLTGTALLVMGLIFVAADAIRPFGRPTQLLMQTSVGAVLIALAAAWAVLGHGHRILGPTRGVLLTVSISAPLAFLLWKIGCSSAYDGMMEPWPTRPGYRCLLLTLSLAIWPLLAVIFLRRRSDPRHPALQGASLGVVFGMCAAAMGDMWCPVGHIPHLLVGHILPVALLALLGAWPLAGILALRSPRAAHQQDQDPGRGPSPP